MFEKNPHGSNFIHELDNDKNYVSFNGSPCTDFNAIQSLVERITDESWRNPDGNAETALKYNGTFYIVDGDWRDKYQDCKTGEEAFKVFEDLSAEHGESYWNRR